VSRSIGRAAFRGRIEDLDVVRPRGSALVTAPHGGGGVHPVVVRCSTRRPVHFLAKRQIVATPVLGSLIRNVDAYPVTRGRVGPPRSSTR